MTEGETAHSGHLSPCTTICTARLAGPSPHPEFFRSLMLPGITFSPGVGASPGSPGNPLPQLVPGSALLGSQSSRVFVTFAHFPLVLHYFFCLTHPS